MASHLAWLRTLKLSQLKTIASQTGINSSGTKTILNARLLAELPLERVSAVPQGGLESLQGRHGSTRHKDVVPNQCRIISIDMGIRNLAYCVLDLPHFLEREATLSKTLSDWEPFTPTVQAWKRIAINHNVGLPTESFVDPETDNKTKEAFDPSTYASYAYSFVSEVLLPHRPTTILIERQRYRSMGSSAVQEWTVRVNMLESMLYAVFKTLGEQAKWSGGVHAVMPAKVGPFWLGDSDPEQKPRAKSTKAKAKKAKIDLVGKWLECRHAVELSGQAQMMGKAFLERWQGKGQRFRKANLSPKIDGIESMTTEGNREIGKLDDLADCLLQGLAWVRWEENRRRICKCGPQALAELG